MVQKLVGPRAMSAHALSTEVGMPQGTLSRWLKRAATIPSTMSSADTDTKAHNWSPEEKVAFVLEAAAVPNAELGALLRRRGVLEAQLSEWLAISASTIDRMLSKCAASLPSRPRVSRCR